ncbi:MAG: HEAT repeat domain-containing protein [Pyrinomonadaceae bacterium]
MEANLRELWSAIEARDAERVEFALYDCYKAGLTPEHVPALIELLGQAWHYRHEDVVHALQELKDPRAVDALYEEAHASYEYLAYDEFYGLARKCTWALADIRSPEAKAKLEMLAREGNELVAEYARKRLDRWNSELARKGTPNKGMNATREQRGS